MGERTFVDEVTIHLTAGAGGDGCVSFLREKHRPKGKPNGGDGGKGGSIILRVDLGEATLRAFSFNPHHKARSGGQGSSNDKSGADSDDIVLSVPDGTEVRDAGSGELVADLVGPGTEVVAARGGRSGRGNQTLASATRRAPGFAERGEPGESVSLRLTLKVLADVGLVGFPNAGKSSLLRAISAARPEVAAYPFTTLTPHLGVVRVGDGRFVVADVPGLIEGAAEGRGLGHAFLRHLERCGVLCLVLDATDPERAPADAVRSLTAELRAYDPALLDRVRIGAVNKLDLGSDVQLADATAAVREAGIEPVVISAVTGDGIDPLLVRLDALVADARTAAAGPRSHRLIRIRPLSEEVTVRREDDRWRVESHVAERLLTRFDTTNPEALAFLQGRFDDLGIEDALAAAGARRGDDVIIGGLVFTFSPDRSEAGG